MRTRSRTALLLAAAGAILACRSDDGDVTGACLVAVLGECTEYAARPSVAREQAACDVMGGTWIAACPSVNRFGVCALTRPERGSYAIHYYPGLYVEPASPAAWCGQAGGAWTEGPGASVGAPEAATITCDERAAVVGPRACVEASGSLPPEQRRALEAVCELNGGTDLAGGPCPAEGRTGRCSGVPRYGGLVGTAHFYDPATAAADEADCTAGGWAWTQG